METIFRFSIYQFKKFGLNRTMQYGNFLNLLHIHPPPTGFKSHYVVWKHIKHTSYFSCYICLNRTMQYGNASHPSKNSLLSVTFKSHYVVWKHSLLALDMDEDMEFKSHYVVWKLTSQIVCGKCVYCLNRTMQYGNFLDHNEDVQNQVGLNRTMQYGNPFQGIPPYPGDWFKSHYVVWKHGRHWV